MLDPYKILEVPQDASLGEIKKSYFRLIKHHPPEREPEKFKELRAAYEKLKNVLTRVETDILLFKEPESDFEGPPSKYQSFRSEITQDDIYEMICALYSDFCKTNFNDDYSDVSF